MLEIDVHQGFRVLDVYHRMKTILRVKGKIRGESAESCATIIGTSPGDEEICLRLFYELDGPNWLCKISIANSRFWLDEGARSGASEGQRDDWWGLLRIQQEDGSELLVGEQLAATIN